LQGIVRFLRLARLALTGQPRVRRVSSAELPTEWGPFAIHVFEDALDDLAHVALVKGAVGDGEEVLARIHSACLTGDIFHSARCDCGPQLHRAMDLIAAEGRGVILYLNQEGRGIGLANKIKAYSLQDQGYDTVEANHRLGFAADLRDYGIAVLMFRDLGVRSVRLLSNNPRKLAAFEGEGLSVSQRIPIEIPPSASSLRYLQTKKEKLGHQLSGV
jgi:3,4-dihydroxy 2-butanone 4-phosphate synthase/GTP cyclohydrolase II